MERFRFLQSGFASLGTIETRGFDLNLRTNFDFGNAGRLEQRTAGRLHLALRD